MRVEHQVARHLSVGGWGLARPQAPSDSREGPGPSKALYLEHLLRFEQGREERTVKAQARGALITNQLPRPTPHRGQRLSLKHWSLASVMG